MKNTIAFNFALRASVFVLSATAAFWVCSNLWHDNITFDIDGTHYRIASLGGQVTFDNQPQVELEAAQCQIEVDDLVSKYRQMYRDFPAQHPSGDDKVAAYRFAWESNQILGQLQKIGYTAFPSESASNASPATASMKVKPFPTDSKGMPVFFNIAPTLATPPRMLTIPFWLLIAAASFFPGLSIVRRLNVRGGRRREFCAICV